MGAERRRLHAEAEKAGEIVSIHTGEAGVRVGNTTWELYCLEHGIAPNGDAGCQDLSSVDTFFAMTPKRKCVPRAIFADTDSCSVEDIQTGQFRHLYNPKHMITGKEDAANCFARGYMTLGRELIDTVMNRLRNLADEASNLQGIFLFRSVGGGTGSGMASYLLEQIRDEYKKVSVLEIPIYPSPKISSIIVEPYNALMATHSSLSTVDCSLMFDNDAVYDICDRELDVYVPGMVSLNRVISQVMSAITSQFRFAGDPNVNIRDFQTNLVPYPRLHFPVVAYAPFVKVKTAQHSNYTVASVTNDCLEASNQMVKCNAKNGKYVSCCFLYRGDVNAAEVKSALASIRTKKSVKFVGWLPTKFKVGVNFIPPVTVPGSDMAMVNKSCVMLANNSALRSEWENLGQKYEMMFAKKAFIHWYLNEGLEEADFLETIMDIQTLISDYKELESDK